MSGCAYLDPYGELFARLGLRGGGAGVGAVGAVGADPVGVASAAGISEAERDRVLAIRRQLVWAFSWAVPSREAVLEIASHSPLIEIGAGTGYWAWLLRQAGADVVAYDRAPEAPPQWTEVLRGGVEMVGAVEGQERAVRNAGGVETERTLFLCWPPMGEGLAAECLERYEGERVLSIGERGEGARTGDARFRALLSERFVEERVVVLPQWPGFVDCLTVYRRR